MSTGGGFLESIDLAASPVFSVSRILSKSLVVTRMDHLVGGGPLQNGRLPAIKVMLHVHVHACDTLVCTCKQLKVLGLVPICEGKVNI